MSSASASARSASFTASLQSCRDPFARLAPINELCSAVGYRLSTPVKLIDLGRLRVRVGIVVKAFKQRLRELGGFRGGEGQYFGTELFGHFGMIERDRTGPKSFGFPHLACGPKAALRVHDKPIGPRVVSRLVVIDV